MVENSPESEKYARDSHNNDEVYVVPAFTGLGAPYWNQNARGSVFGLTRGTSKEDFIKATLQSIAYQVRDIIDTMQVDTQTAIQVLKVDGGAAMNNFLMQFQADILGIDIARAKKLGNNSSRSGLPSRFVSRVLERLGRVETLERDRRTL